MILRIDRLADRAAAAVRPRSRGRRGRPGAARRQVRRDVDADELHVPVVQLPRPPGRAAVLRPGRQHRRRGVRPHRAGRRRRSTRCSPAPADRRRARPTTAARGLKGVRNPQHFIAGGQGALPQDSTGKPWNGDYVFSSGDLVEDLTHNFFLETGARNNKLKVYEMVDHPAARALTGYLLGPRRRPPGRLRPRAGEPDRRRPDEAVPDAADPDREDPRVPAAHRARRAPAALPLLAERLPASSRPSSTAPHPETGEELEVVDEAARGRAAARPAAAARGVRPDYAPEEIAEIAAAPAPAGGHPRRRPSWRPRRGTGTGSPAWPRRRPTSSPRRNRRRAEPQGSARRSSPTAGTAASCGRSRRRPGPSP